MIPQNNIVDFALPGKFELHDRDIMLIEQLHRISGDLLFYDDRYKGTDKDYQKKLVLKNLWSWLLKNYIPYLKD